LFILKVKLFNPFYYIDLSVLLKNTPRVKFIRNHIQDLGGVFSISSLVKSHETIIIWQCSEFWIEHSESFKIGNLFGVKDPIPGGLRSRVVYKFTCAGCNACYVSETSRHFFTCVREHLAVDRASHIFKHL